VDDNADNLRLLARILGNAGYLVRPARNGKLALESAQAMRPDLILLDIMMPEMDGFEVCRHLKADEQTRNIPVIFISALNAVQDKVKSFEVGGVDFITKPFQSAEVLARVKTQITVQELQGNLREQIAELDAFAHTVAHDLKSPLTLIIGFADHLMNTHDRLPPQDLVAFLHRIHKAGNKASNIIDELLLLASVREQDVESRTLPMQELVALALDRLRYMIEEHEAEVITPERWPQALGYAPWIEEVWVNYLSNAIKYGGAPPRLELGAETADGAARFWVKDNGPGLSPAEQENLFTEFMRLSERKVEGHGLGLSIVQRIVRKLGGRVGVESEEGQGCLFYFTLPAPDNQD
jgi:signal transduction histidine kinase